MDPIQNKLTKFGLNDINSSTFSTYASHLWVTTTAYSDADFQYSTGQEGEFNRFSRPLLTVAAIMTIIIMVIGIAGNLLTIVALIKCPKVRNVAAAFIISLCIADCIFCAVVLPFNAFRFIQGTWTHGEILCRVIPFIQYGNIGVSLLCIAMITINRYVMIAHHSSYSKIYKRHWIGVMIGFCWLFSYGMQLPTFFKIWGFFGYDSKLGTCSILKDNNGRSSKTALFIIAFLIPCIIIVCCYARIFWVVHKSELRLRKHATKQNSIPNNLRTLPSRGSSQISSGSINLQNSNNDKKIFNTSQKSIHLNDQRDVKTKRNEWRITKMVLAIFLSFIMCYLPITVIKITDKDANMPGFHILGYIMLYLSSCINPIIYVIMNKQYRQAYKTVLMCKPSRLLPFSNVGSSAAEMERYRVQLQPQSYHGIPGINSRLYQQSPASYGGAYSNRQPSESIERSYYPEHYPFQTKFIQTQQQCSNISQQYQQQSLPKQTNSKSLGITATIYPTPRFTASKYAHYIGNGGRRKNERIGENTEDDSKSTKRHSR